MFKKLISLVTFVVTVAPLAKKAWEWYTEWQRKKDASNQSGGSIDRLGD